MLPLDEQADFGQTAEWRGEKERGMLSLSLEEGQAAWIDLAVNQWTQQAAAERLLPRLVKEACGNFCAAAGL
ncbi:hypothetical protein ACFTAO_14270 [Paenibacillus rhizoplanae]